MTHSLRIPELPIAGRKHKSSVHWGPGVQPNQTLLYMVLILSLLVLMVSGCGKSKDELENLKEQTVKLESGFKQLSDHVGRLDQTSNQIADGLKKLSDSITQMQQGLENLTKTQADLTDTNNEIKKKNSNLAEEFASLKTQTAGLAQGVEELKNRFNDMGLWPKPTTSIPADVGSPTKMQSDKLSPCDAVIAYMKKTEDILRQHPRGTERAKSLEQLKRQFAPRMKGAPEKAIKGAEDWVNGLIKLWDQESSDNSMLGIIEQRNVVLEACGKSPSEAGF
jgi:X-X-X-Leu-X-X-Gly heptad repeat protein